MLDDLHVRRGDRSAAVEACRFWEEGCIAGRGGDNRVTPSAARLHGVEAGLGGKAGDRTVRGALNLIHFGIKVC